MENFLSSPLLFNCVSNQILEGIAFIGLDEREKNETSLDRIKNLSNEYGMPERQYGIVLLMICIKDGF